MAQTEETSNIGAGISPLAIKIRILESKTTLPHLHLHKHFMVCCDKITLSHYDIFLGLSSVTPKDIIEILDLPIRIIQIYKVINASLLEEPVYTFNADNINLNIRSRLEYDSDYIFKCVFD